jgi:RNA polymerase sigma-70 factor (sigma-E family)
MNDMGSPRDVDFADYFVARAPVLRRTAFVVVQDWHIAEDVTQRAFLKLYGAWPRVSPAGRDAYARRVVINESLSLLRRRKPEVLTDRPPERAATHDPPDAAALDVVQALALLSPQQRAVVALRFLHDLPVRDTAEALRITEGTVKSHTSRAMDTLRRHLPDLISQTPTHEETP